jgi:isoquinoline 1-oxidoreductase alpha subunit
MAWRHAGALERHWRQAMPLRISVNGNPHEVISAPETPLLWVLRDEMNLTGTKYGCGIGQCGACTVHLGGVPVRSCQFPVESVKDSSITTVEGLDDRHPVRRAWVNQNVAQCGYCQSGQIMSAAALLAKNAHPSNDDIDAAMSGNICRCGTYLRIRAAIREAASDAAGPEART